MSEFAFAEARAVDVLEIVGSEPAELLIGHVDLNEYLEAIKADVAIDEIDISTKTGRDRIKSAAQTIRSRKAAIDKRREIKLRFNVGAVLNIDTVNLLALIACLFRDKRRAKHLFGELDRFGWRACETYAALLTRFRFLELALAAPACMDLGLHHIKRPRERFRRRFRLIGAQNRNPVRHRRAERFQQLFGLVFVNIHESGSAERKTFATYTGARPIGKGFGRALMAAVI